MPDLNDLLRDAADADDGVGHISGERLLAAGKRRVVRRRVAAAGGATLAAAVLVAGAVVVGDLRGSDRADVVEPTRHDGIYRSERLSVAEMEARCTDALNAAFGTDERWVAGRSADNTGVSAVGSGADLFTAEGEFESLVPEGETWGPDGVSRDPRADDGSRFEIETSPRLDDYGPASAECLVPHEHLVEGMADALEQPLPSADDPAAVLEACSRRNGFDLLGWDALAAAEIGSSVVAVGLSTDGHPVQCDLSEHGDLVAVDDWPLLRPDGTPKPPAPGDHKLQWYVESWYGEEPAEDRGGLVGVLPGLPDGYLVEALVDGQVIASTTTHRGGFAVGFDLPTGARGRLTGRLTDSQGDVLWEGRLIL